MYLLLMRWFASFFLLVSMSSCWMIRAYRIRHLKLTDYKKFSSIVIHKPETSFHFAEATSSRYNYIKIYLDSTLPQTKTVAFLIIKNDSVIYEKYFDGFTKQSLLPSNSMAKSFTGTLVSIAMDEGKIKSTDENITHYIPELLKTDSGFKKITIQHLLDMRSGLQFNEGKYNIKDDAVKLGMRPNIVKHLLKVKIAQPPGRFKYQSVNTQLLGLILERATGKKISAYLEEKLWKPFGAEQDALWNTDKKNHEFTSAGLNATARDFAKLGRLYLNGGKWNNKQIVNANWVATISNVDTMEKYGGYKNQWWSRAAYHSFSDSLTANSFKEKTLYSTSVRKMQNNYRVSYRTNSFSAIGFYNQAIYVDTQKKLIIVRLGLKWQHPDLPAIQFLHDLAERL